MNWDNYYNEAKQYQKTASNAYQKRQFNNELVYHLLSMSIENYLTALCFRLGDPPIHSGIVLILRQLKKQLSVPETFIDEARFVNRFMTFCSLQVVDAKVPEDQEVKRMLLFLAELRGFCDLQLFKQDVEHKKVNQN